MTPHPTTCYTGPVKMMTPTSLLRIGIICGGMGMVCTLTGCKLPNFSPRLPQPPVTPNSPSRPTGHRCRRLLLHEQASTR